jgi:hypothetical protein
MGRECGGDIRVSLPSGERKPVGSPELGRPVIHLSKRRFTMRKILFISFALTLVLGAVAFLAQEKGKPGEKAPPPVSAEQKAAMEAMQKAATPGEYHKFLAKMEGTWKAEVKSYEAPGEPQVSLGTSVNTMVLGGRYLKQEFKSSFMNMPFEGIGFTGYDNVQKRFQATWMDNMSTAMMYGTGALDASGKVLTSTMTYSDPVTGKEQIARSIGRIVDDKTHVFEMYGPGRDGKEFKMMEITYRKS